MSQPDRSLLIPKDPYLVLLEGIDTKTSDTLSELEWPTFTPDVESRYGLFVTHTKGIFFFSLDPWVPSLEKELQSNDSLGATFRMDIIKNGPGALRERILTFKDINDLVSESSVAACLVLQDSDLGYLTLTSVDGEPRAAVLDRPHVEPAAPFAEEQEEIYIPDLHMLSLDVPREVYRTPTAFSDPSSLPRFFEQHVPARHRRLMKQQVRMSTATLDLMTQAHRVLSEETHQLGVAAADLFRRCERLQEELRDQISRANEVAHRTEQIVGEDTDEYLGGKAGTIQARLDERMKNVRSRHQDLVARHVALGRKFSKVGGTGLSEKERRWFSEIEKARETIGVPPLENEQGEENEEEEIIESEAWQRFQDAKDLANDLVARAREAADQERTGRPNEDGMDMIPSDLRKEGVTKVMKLLEREYVFHLRS